MYLFDTDVLSNLMARVPSSRLQEKIGTVPMNEQFTSSITLGELTYGAHKKRSKRRLKMINRVIAHLPILPYDADAAMKFSKIKADLESAGRTIGDSDTQIAAIALVHGLTVVTGNVKHFQRVEELQVENWL